MSRRMDHMVNGLYKLPVVSVELTIRLYVVSLYVYCRRNNYHNSTLVTNDVSYMSVEREAGAVAALNLKIPPFWPSDPDLWFAQVEAQFSTRGITSQKTKDEHVVASLSPEFATQVRDLILRIPDTTPYDTLKRQLITRTALPEQRHLQQLLSLSSTELGDQRPTQLLRRMQQLLGGGAADADAKLLRELFLQRLPGNVRMVLASFGDTKTLDELAELGDNIIAAGPPGVSGFTQPEPSREVEELRSELSQLRERVSALSTSTRTRSPSPRRRPFRPRSPPPHPTPTSMCWYHARFGDMARKCTPPCSYSGNGKAST